MSGLDYRGVCPGAKRRKYSKLVLDHDHFDLLLQQAGVRSIPLIAALKDHFLGGLGKSISAQKHGIKCSQLSRCIGRILHEYEVGKKMSRFYPREQAAIGVFTLATNGVINSSPQARYIDIPLV